MIKSVILSDGKPCPVRVLGINELIKVGPKDPGPYRYQVLTIGGIEESTYDLAEAARRNWVPRKPDKPEVECEPNSQDWLDWQDYHTYQAAIAHEAKRWDIEDEHLENVMDYILENCVSAEDRFLVVTAVDYKAVTAAAMVPELEMADIEQALEETFGARFSGREVLAALAATEPGSASVQHPTRWWEMELLTELGIWRPEDEAQYGQIPVDERARRVVGIKLKDWLTTLEIDREVREMRAKA
jgi:hypothetical protein